MENPDLFSIALIYLLAALVVVPLAKLSGLGVVLGYLGAGLIIGPFGFSLVGDQTSVMQFAEFGVVVMLFLAGLELKRETLVELRGYFLGLGGGQMLTTTAFIAVILILMGWSWPSAVVVGMSFAASSTAMALQAYKEKGWTSLRGGQAGFATLLFQDVAIIPIIILIPLLASVGGAEAPVGADITHGHHAELAPFWQILLVIAGLIVIGHYVVRHVFRFIAQTGAQELFTVAALALVVGVNKLMTMVGMSPALGAFLAGIILAENEYRREIETDLEPFRGLLMGLFFLTVGASLNLALLISDWANVLLALGGLMLVKGLAIYIVARAMRLDLASNLMLVMTLSQGGEFGFVLFALAAQSGAVEASFVPFAGLVVTLSLAVTPVLIVIYDRLIVPRLQGEKAPMPEAGTMRDSDVIVAGFGRFGQVVSRLLSSQGIKPVLLDYDAQQVNLVRKFGSEVYFGDASRLDLLHTAGADKAKLLVVAVDSMEKSLAIVDLAKKHFPNLTVVARARNREHVYELLNRDIDLVQRETFASAINLGVMALKELGVSDRRAKKAGERFTEHDNNSLLKLAGYWGNEKQYGAAVRDSIEVLRKALEKDQEEYELPSTRETDAVESASPDSLKPAEQPQVRSPKAETQSESETASGAGGGDDARKERETS